ncbi:MAG: hypothetical protein PHQ42_02095 [Patescibacteria group bacterium]|nr:hypothetical protein [Patescibacteria group bacterium]
MKNLKVLERIYFTFLFIIFFLVVLTPALVKCGFFFIKEEFLEMEIILFLFAIGYIILKLYRREVAKNLEELEKIKREKGSLEARMMEAFKYIGEVNVQIQEIRSIFSSIKKIPENKKDFRYILKFFSDKILGIVNVGWVAIRIIDRQSSVSLQEYYGTRGGVSPAKQKINNNDLLRNKKLGGCRIITSSQENFRIKTFCIIPEQKISRDQEDLIRGIINQLEMLFVIFSSNYYKGGHLRVNK